MIVSRGEVSSVIHIHHLGGLSFLSALLQPRDTKHGSKSLSKLRAHSTIDKEVEWIRHQNYQVPDGWHHCDPSIWNMTHCLSMKNRPIEMVPKQRLNDAEGILTWIVYTTRMTAIGTSTNRNSTRITTNIDVVFFPSQWTPWQLPLPLPEKQMPFLFMRARRRCSVCFKPKINRNWNGSGSNVRPTAFQRNGK